MSGPLPKGVTAQRMATALRAFAAIVGQDWLFVDEDVLSSYADAFAPGNADAHAPAAAIGPASVADVQAIVRIAAEHGIPLWTVSRGRNLAYGGSAPVLPGSVVLDLKRLDRIVEIDEELGYAIVEPGVSFFDLHEALEARGGKLWISSPAPGWGSVMGNALERGFGPMPYGDHGAQICGLEVVLADGSLLRTGMGAVPGSATGPIFRGGFGPQWDMAFTQSNLGIVTKMGIWLMPRPEAMAYTRVDFAREEDLGTAVDTLRPLRVEGLINGVPAMRNILGSAIGASQRKDWYDRPGPIPDDVLTAMQAKLKLGWWSLQYGIYGRAETVKAHARIAAEAFGKVAGATVDTEIVEGAALAGPTRGGAGSRAGIPGLNALGIVDWRGGAAGGHIDFSPVLPPRGADALKLHRMARAIIEGGGQDYMATFYNFGRAMALICAITFDKTDDAETARVRRLFSRLIKDVGAAGYGEYRTHISYMDEVAALYSWNDSALARFNVRIKDALDPAGILSPGKQGLWPARYRSNRKAVS